MHPLCLCPSWVDWAAVGVPAPHSHVAKAPINVLGRSLCSASLWVCLPPLVCSGLSAPSQLLSRAPGAPRRNVYVRMPTPPPIPRPWRR